MKLILALLMIFIIFEIPISYGMGLIFKKMKLEFTKGIIPFYNKIILIKKYNMPQYHLILIFIPILGLYTNYLVYNKICEKYNKNIIYILKLTFLPFIYNVLLGLELKEIEESEQIGNYFEDQKNLYEKGKKEEPKPEDEYVWRPKKNIKSDTIYKASRNNITAKVNVNKKPTNEIIDNKKPTRVDNDKTKLCPNCGAKLKENALICFVCGEKLEK